MKFGERFHTIGLRTLCAPLHCAKTLVIKIHKAVVFANILYGRYACLRTLTKSTGTQPVSLSPGASNHNTPPPPPQKKHKL